MAEPARPPGGSSGGDDSRKRSHLGKGLMALLGTDNEQPDAPTATERTSASRTLPVEMLKPGRFQPRMRFDDEPFNSLVASVREKGILQPILVRRDPDQTTMYEIIAGERRWRAAQEAQLHEVPVLIREMGDRDALELALVENIQRQDLTAIEEAEGYHRLMEEFKHTQEGLAQAIGKSRSHIANMLRLLNLPQKVKDLVQSGALTSGHARALIGSKDPVALADHAVNKGLNVRQVERLAQSERSGPPRRRSFLAKDADTVALERELSNHLGLLVQIQRMKNGGDLVIHFTSFDQLNDLIRRIRPPS